MNPLTLDLRPVIRLTHEQFEQIAITNRDLQLELTVNGELVIIPATGGNIGRRNADLIYQLQAWNRQTQLGVVFILPQSSVCQTERSVPLMLHG